MATEGNDVENFLDKVNEIDALIKDLKSVQDSEEHKDALQKADNFLSNMGREEKRKEQKKNFQAIDRTGVNRTVINQKAFEHEDSPAAGPDIDPQMNQEAFLAAMEADAKRRANKRSQQRKEATVIKEQGNQQFKEGNYQKAIELYTEALGIIKDYSALWTNRAQCYIKLEKYDKAMEDCEWALKISDKCLKAHIHKGRALIGLQKYDEALECFNLAIEVEPNKEKSIMEYIHAVELKKQCLAEEQVAKESFEAGQFEAKGIVEIMGKIHKLDHLPYYYSGGLRLLTQVMKDTKEKALFRSNGGLKLTETHPYIARCFGASVRSLSQDEVDLVAATLEAFTQAATDNEVNQKEILELEKLPGQIVKFLDSKWKSTRLVKEAALKMLHLMSENQSSRPLVVAKYDMSMLLSSVFTLMKSKSHKVTTTSIGLVNNLALEKKFKIGLRSSIDDVLPSFENVMLDEESNESVLPSCISTVTNLCGDSAIRHRLLHRKQTWQACSLTLKRFAAQYNQPQKEEVLFALLGLFMNLTLDKSDNLQQFAVDICSQCHVLLTSGKSRLEERSCGVLSHVLPHSGDAVKHMCDKGVVPYLLGVIKTTDSTHLKSAVKTLTVCTQDNIQARQQILDTEKGLKAVYDLLKHSDEQILGNASLCLGHCVTLPGVSEALAKTKVLMDLLVLARDSKHANVRHNCAILIAKLAQRNPKHLERLRELDGLGILHDVLKIVKE